MKILFIAHESQLNGASKSLLDLICEYEKRHKIYVLTAFDYGPFFEELQKTRAEIIVRPYYRWVIKKVNLTQWVQENLKWFIKRKRINHSTINEMTMFCKKNTINIIHTNSGVINLGACISHKSGIKHIWHIREFADLDFEMYPYTFKSIYHSSLRDGADSFICNSYAVAQYYNFIPSAKKYVIYNGVASENLIEVKKQDSRITNFLLAGRYSDAKGQDWAIQACKILKDNGINNFVLNFAGSMTEKIKVPYTLKENIIIHGEVRNMPELRKNIDVELVCSRAEAFGRVTIEAMMGSIPVIGSNTGGTVELIKDGVNGFLYEYENISDLASKMKYMIENPKERIEMGKKAQDFAKKFSTKNYALEIEKIYYKTLGKFEDDINK